MSTAASVSRTGVDTVTGPGSSAVAAMSTRAFSWKIRQNKGTAYRLLETVLTERVRCPAASPSVTASTLGPNTRLSAGRSWGAATGKDGGGA
ncbi:hypothetical protein [Streptomyces hawaiiensis]|uniref:hypothetical protein n=1 Tax=Streptomyces hawaiiensis TaxID=67305 RepID=UPI001585FBE3|nr:hypothetical protein [Streptomyces hawaiiensis]